MKIDHRANKAKCRESIGNIKKFIADYMDEDGPKEELMRAIDDYSKCQIKNALSVHAKMSMNPSAVSVMNKSSVVVDDDESYESDEDAIGDENEEIQ